MKSSSEVGKKTSQDTLSIVAQTSAVLSDSICFHLHTFESLYS